MNIITILNTFIALTMIIILTIPLKKKEHLSLIALLASGIIFVTSLVLLTIPFITRAIYLNKASYSLFFPLYDNSYDYTVDGLSIVYIVLTTILTFLVILLTLKTKENVKYYYLTIFLVELLLVNCFITSDIFYFYILFESIIIPFYFLIGIWGVQKERVSAGYQFVLYTLLGSFFMFAGICILFVLLKTTNIHIIVDSLLTTELEKIIFFFTLLGFVVKVPMVPFHSWLTKAHVEAPTPASILLAGILLKLGSYGFLRFLFPILSKQVVYYTPEIILFAAISLLLASVVIFRILDLKRIIAYSSIAHMNYLIAGITVKSMVAQTGSILLQTAHGLSSSALFACVGMLYDRYKTRSTYYYRGLNVIMPFFCFFFMIFCLANIGFPLTLNFSAEILLFFGLMETMPSFAFISLIGTFIGGLYFFVIGTKICYGPFTQYIKAYFDLSRREVFLVTLFSSLIIILGLKPTYLIELFFDPLCLLSILGPMSISYEKTVYVKPYKKYMDVTISCFDYLSFCERKRIYKPDKTDTSRTRKVSLVFVEDPAFVFPRNMQIQEINYHINHMIIEIDLYAHSFCGSTYPSSFYAEFPHYCPQTICSTHLAGDVAVVNFEKILFIPWDPSVIYELNDCQIFGITVTRRKLYKF